MKKILLLINVLLLSGCSITPYEKLNLDTTSNFTTPTRGKAGIYVYQDAHKLSEHITDGEVQLFADVEFELKDFKKIQMNSHEFAYFEINPGSYEYKFSGGMIAQYAPIKIEANKNYFFRTALLQGNILIPGVDNALLVRDQKEIDDAKNGIKNGTYKINTKDSGCWWVGMLSGKECNHAQ